MIYILIVLWIGGSQGGKAGLAVEFNDLKSCQAAAAEIRKQDGAMFTDVGTIVCAAKGERK